MVKKFLLIKLIYTLALFPRALADTATPVEKNQPAPYAGILMDQEKSNSVKIGLQERDLFEQIVTSQTKSIELLKQNNTYSENKVNILLEQNDKLSERLQNAQSLSTFEKVGLFVLGIAATVGAGLALKSISK